MPQPLLPLPDVMPPPLNRMPRPWNDPWSPVPFEETYPEYPSLDGIPGFIERGPLSLFSYTATPAKYREALRLAYLKSGDQSMPLGDAQGRVGAFLRLPADQQRDMAQRMRILPNRMTAGDWRFRGALPGEEVMRRLGNLEGALDNPRFYGAEGFGAMRPSFQRMIDAPMPPPISPPEGTGYLAGLMDTPPDVRRSVIHGYLEELKQGKRRLPSSRPWFDESSPSDTPPQAIPPGEVPPTFRHTYRPPYMPGGSIGGFFPDKASTTRVIAEILRIPPDLRSPEQQAIIDEAHNAHPEIRLTEEEASYLPYTLRRRPLSEQEMIGKIVADAKAWLNTASTRQEPPRGGDSSREAYPEELLTGGDFDMARRHAVLARRARATRAFREDALFRRDPRLWMLWKMGNDASGGGGDLDTPGGMSKMAIMSGMFGDREGAQFLGTMANNLGQSQAAMAQVKSQQDIAELTAKSAEAREQIQANAGLNQLGYSQHLTRQQKYEEALAPYIVRLSNRELAEAQLRLETGMVDPGPYIPLEAQRAAVRGGAAAAVRGEAAAPPVMPQPLPTAADLVRQESRTAISRDPYYIAGQGGASEWWSTDAGHANAYRFMESNVAHLMKLMPMETYEVMSSKWHRNQIIAAFKSLDWWAPPWKHLMYNDLARHFYKGEEMYFAKHGEGR